MNRDTIAAVIEGTDCSSTKALAAALRILSDAAKERGLQDELFKRKASVVRAELNVPDLQLSQLVQAGIVSKHPNGTVTSEVMLHEDPHLGRLSNLDALTGVLLATDWPDVSPGARQPFDGREMVFPLHYESLAVINEIAVDGPPKGARVLDSFCGSGVLGVYASLLGAIEVVFSDHFSRALAFTRLNTALNDLKGVKIERSDSLSGIDKNQGFDLVLANPPFEAVADNDREFYFYHSFGGPTGERYMNQFLSEVGSLLREGGKVVTVDFILSDATGARLEDQAKALKMLSPELTKAEIKIAVHGQVPLRQFWVRFDALGIDRQQKLLRQFLEADDTHLVLATVAIKKSNRSFFEHQPTILEQDQVVENWWNPLDWPLPCGISVDRSGVDSWLGCWFSYEAEHRSEQAAIHAESLAVEPDGQLGHWDFSWAFLEKESAESRTLAGLRTALASTVLDLRFMAIATAVMPVEVALILLPEKPHSGEAVRLSFSTLPLSSKTSRTEVARDIQAEVLRFGQLQAAVGDVLADEDSFLYWYAVKQPPTLGPGPLDTSTYSQMASGRLVLGRNEYRFPEAEERETDLRSLLVLSKNEVQAYLLTIRLPHGGIKALREWSEFVGRDWRELASRQYFGFMRDRMTQFAIPMILGSQIDAVARAEEQAKEREHVLNFASHTVIGPAADALQYVRWAEKGIEPQKNLARASLRISRLRRNAETILTAKRASTGNRTPKIRMFDLRETVLGPLVAEIAEDRMLGEKPSIEVDFSNWQIEGVPIPDDGVVELILVTLIQNACEHFDRASGSGWDGDALIQLRARIDSGAIVMEVENSGPIVSTKAIDLLNSKALLDERHWGISRKGADHYGIGVGKVKWLASQIGCEMHYSKGKLSFCAALTIPMRTETTR